MCTLMCVQIWGYTSTPIWVHLYGYTYMGIIYLVQYFLKKNYDFTSTGAPGVNSKIWIYSFSFKYKVVATHCGWVHMSCCVCCFCFCLMLHFSTLLLLLACRRTDTIIFNGMRYRSIKESLWGCLGQFKGNQIIFVCLLQFVCFYLLLVFYFCFCFACCCIFQRCFCCLLVACLQAYTQHFMACDIVQ